MKMMMNLSRAFPVVLLALVALAGELVWAQAGEQVEGVTPSRLSIAEGPVSFWRPGMDAWSAAELNTALATGDAIYAGDRGTAEIQVGPQDYVRLTSNTMMTVVAQEAGLLQFRVDSGTASFDLRSVQAGQMIEVDMPNGAIVVGRTGYYRVDIRGTVTHVTVRRGGQATFVLDGGRNQSISSGEELLVSGERERGTAVERRAAVEPDAWDRWNFARSDYYANSQSQRYVPAGVYGVGDLDQYGTWRDYPAYGHVWVPTVAAGWAPYSTGRWRWDSFYGWTWIDVAPWGWATCHYGRWVLINGFWAWAPGPRIARPVYAPALVAFFEGGSGVSWVALGWGEPLIPWWGRPGFRGMAWWGGWGGPRIVNHRVHHSGTVDVGSIRFAHVGVPKAVISVRHEDFHRERFHGSRLPPPQARELVPVRGAHPVRPTNVAAPVVGGRPFQATPAVRERTAAPGATVSPMAPAGQAGTSPQPLPQAAPTAPLPRPEAAVPGQIRHRHDGQFDAQERSFGRGRGPERVTPQSPPPAPAPSITPAPASPASPGAPAPAPTPAAPPVQRQPPVMAPMPVPAPVAPPVQPQPSVTAPMPAPAPVAPPVQPQPSVTAPMPATSPAPPPVQRQPPVMAPMPGPAPVAPPVQRQPPVMAPMPGMGTGMSGAEPRVFRERGQESRHEERRHQERPRPEARGEQQRFPPPPQGSPGEPAGRMFPRQRD